MTHSEFSISLRNYAGIPVVELVGEINRKTLARLNDILGKLARAGHYNVMVNLKRAAWQNLDALNALKKAAELFQTHYGNVDVIADMEQIDGLRKLELSNGLFRFCTSEGQALTRIKRLPATSSGGVIPTSAHLADSC